MGTNDINFDELPELDKDEEEFFESRIKFYLKCNVDKCYAHIACSEKEYYWVRYSILNHKEEPRKYEDIDFENLMNWGKYGYSPIRTFQIPDLLTETKKKYSEEFIQYNGSILCWREKKKIESSPPLPKNTFGFGSIKKWLRKKLLAIIYSINRKTSEMLEDMDWL